MLVLREFQHMKQILKKQHFVLVCDGVTAAFLCVAHQIYPLLSADLAPELPAETVGLIDSESKTAGGTLLVEQYPIQSAFPSAGGHHHCVLRGDETIDLTGIPLSGRKDIIKRHTLTPQVLRRDTGEQ